MNKVAFYAPQSSQLDCRFTGRMRKMTECAIRCIHTVADCPRLTRFSLHPPKNVEVEFDNGNAYSLSAEYLRIYSPAVDSKIRSIGGEKVISGRRHVGIMSAEPVGNYGVRYYNRHINSGTCDSFDFSNGGCRLLFDDLHKTGIFTWDYFYHLGSNKFTLMRNYVTTLKKHGLSRDPPRRK